MFLRRSLSRCIAVVSEIDSLRAVFSERYFVIVSEAMARRFWPGDDPLGSPLKASLVFPDIPPQPWQIVGIAGDVRADAGAVREKLPCALHYSAKM